MSPREQPYNRYIHALHEQRPIVRRLSYILQIIQYTQVIAELGVKKLLKSPSFSGLSGNNTLQTSREEGAEKGRWKFVLWLELAKFILKVVIFHRSGNRPLLSGLVPERDPSSHNASISPGSEWKAARMGDIGGPLAGSSGEVTKYLVSKALVSGHKRNPIDLLPQYQPQSQKYFMELAYFARPLVYAYLRSRDIKGWKPWIVSLLIDIIISNTKSSSSASPLIDTYSYLEQEEKRRRNWMLVYYMLREPFYSEYSKPILQDLCGGMRRVPIVSIVSGVLQEYIPLWENIFYYTSH